MYFKHFSGNTTSPALDAFAITPSATAFATPPRAILVGVGGTITVTTYKGTSLTLTVSAGSIIPLVVTHVTAATATNLVGLI
jgi:hypothetical protein